MNKNGNLHNKSIFGYLNLNLVSFAGKVNEQVDCELLKPLVQKSSISFTISIQKHAGAAGESQDNQIDEKGQGFNILKDDFMAVS
jgi:hypothetical protein